MHGGGRAMEYNIPDCPENPWKAAEEKWVSSPPHNIFSTQINSITELYGIVLYRIEMMRMDGELRRT